MMRVSLNMMLNIYEYLVLYLGLTLLGVMCLIWTPIAFVLYPVLSRSQGRAFGRYVITIFFRFYLMVLSLSGRFSFDLKALDLLRDESSLILAPNHPCLLDAVMIISRLPNVSCVLKDELLNNVFLGAGARLARYISNKTIRNMVDMAQDDFSCNSHLLLFPEGTRTITNPVNSFKGSVGLIGHHAQVPVQTILIETDSLFLSKGWSLFRKPPMPIHYRVRLGRRFYPPEHTKRFMVDLDHYFRNELINCSAFYPPNSLPKQPEREL
jgi:1-acyl-sn-glycerol-3-phosphate acyltransferase